MKSILTYNFMQVIKACPYCKDFKCTEPHIPEMDCISYICARKQAFYYLEAYNVLKAENEQAEHKLERIREVLTNITEAGLCEAKECGCDDNKECLECTLNEIKDVTQIIDEVNDES